MDKNYDMINPPHYRNYGVETIEMMRRIYGDEQAAMWCEMNAFKYRMRMGTKPGNSVEQDLKKEAWYLEKAHSLREKLKA